MAEPSWWTQERTQELRRLAGKGDKSTRQIAGDLGCTRNMVIGKCYREGIVFPRSQPWCPAEPTPNPFPTSGCLWPYGDPGTPEFRFCGGLKVFGKPYCPAHAAIAYVRVPPAVAREMAAAELLLGRVAPRTAPPA